jgi:ABC-type antimicrobial peptide transport system permease subunit
VAIPLESFIASARTVGGAVLVVVMRALAVLLRLAGSFVRQVARVLVTLYDILIVLPLLLERMLRDRRVSDSAPSPPVTTGFEAVERS